MRISNYFLAQKNDLVVLSLEFEAASADAACPCKSSLIQYSAFQTVEGRKSILLESNFSILGISQIKLPVATQQRLIFEDSPVTVTFSCSSSP